MAFASGREIRSCVGADRGNEAKALLPNDSLHVFSQKSPRLAASPAVQRWEDNLRSRAAGPVSEKRSDEPLLG
jgi:hypothetical protein